MIGTSKFTIWPSLENNVINYICLFFMDNVHGTCSVPGNYNFLYSLEGVYFFLEHVCIYINNKKTTLAVPVMGIFQVQGSHFDRQQVIILHVIYIVSINLFLRATISIKKNISIVIFICIRMMKYLTWKIKTMFSISN